MLTQGVITGHLFLILHLLSSLKVMHGENPFTPKASLIRYWKTQIHNSLQPQFFISKASPLSAPQSAIFTKMALKSELSRNLPNFCQSANLLCFPDLSPSLSQHTQSSFQLYNEHNFTSYGTGRLGQENSFKNYSIGRNMPLNFFGHYSRDATGGSDQFLTYGSEGNVVDQRFESYAAGSTGGHGMFKTYNDKVNVPNLVFGSYSSKANGRLQSFSSYTEETNSGTESFRSYGKNSNGAGNGFTEYGKGGNVINSRFTGYGNGANSPNDTFVTYGNDGNVPEQTFQSYGDGSSGGNWEFVGYRDQANVGDDVFQSYGKKSSASSFGFSNYGKSFNEGTDKFKGYGKGANGQVLGFNGYGLNSTFTDYSSKKDVAFKGYTNRSSSGGSVNKWVEPGKFFRESLLKVGTVMPFPDVKDKMPKRSFLPRTISSKLPFSTLKLGELKRVFHAVDNSSMESMLTNSLTECERGPSAGEKKRCVSSGEDMIDFAISILGRNVVVRTTENVEGSKNDIMIGSVSKINGGEVTQSVSCHQSLYPYLMYYCHSVPKVRVYDADLLDPRTKAKINHGVAICHLDTSAWSSTHGAFISLGSGPGQIEVCHWIFENDMTWCRAD